MPITVSNLATSNDNADVGTPFQYTIPSIAPTDGALVVANIMVTGVATVPTLVSMAGGGVDAWSQVQTWNFNSAQNRIYVMRALDLDAGSGAIVLTFSGACNGLIWSIDQFVGVLQTGTNGADAIRGVKAANAGSVTLDNPFLDPVNGVAYGSHYRNAQTAMTPEAGWTQLGSLTAGAPSRAILSQYRVGEDLTVSATGPSVTIGMEIVPAPADTGRTDRTRRPSRLEGLVAA